MWEGDLLADAFVADFATVGHGRAMKMLRTACRSGIAAVPDAPDSLVALFAELDDVPSWVDLAAIDSSAQYLGRYTRQAGIVLGAASLVSGYANSAASRPLEMTGRYIDSAGARTIEVASWLVESTAAGGLHRHGRGFELTVRVRIIHALVRHALSHDERWDAPAWGVPISQAFLAYTLIEFCLIPLRGMRAIGAPYLPHEVAGYYARWRYIGHLLGIDPDLLPQGRADQEALEEIYLLTRPEVEDYCRRLVGSINSDFLVPEIEELLPYPPAARPRPRPRCTDSSGSSWATRSPTSWASRRPGSGGLVRALGPVLGTLNAAVDRVPGTLARRTARGERYRLRQDARLRARYSGPARPGRRGTGRPSHIRPGSRPATTGRPRRRAGEGPATQVGDVGLARLVEALLDGVAGELHPVVHLQLAQGVLDVVLHGAVRDDQPLGDLLVAHSLGHHLEHLGLPLGELGVAGHRAVPAGSDMRRNSPSTSPARPGVKTESPAATRRTASSSSAREADLTR